MPSMNEIVGRKGTYLFLNKTFEAGTPISSEKLAELLVEADIPDDFFAVLESAGLFRRTANDYYLSPLGERITLLLRILNDDGDLQDLFQKLSTYFPRLARYELMKSNITEYFIDALYSKPDFIRVLICSPWIKLDDNHLKRFEGAVASASRLYKNIEMKIISLPPEGYRNWKASEKTFETFNKSRADVVFHRKKNAKNQYELHTKLYIVEPGPYGGPHFAIVGSENLTGQGNIELAIKINNDNEMLRKLHDYYSDVLQEALTT
jgi:hypothetical protein